MTYKLDLKLDPSEICTAQQKGVSAIHGHIKVYTKPKVVESNERIRDAMITAMREIGIRFKHIQIKKKRGDHARYILKRVVDNPIPKRVPIQVVIVYQFPFQSNASQKRKAHGWEPMIERPDVDNLTKSIFDIFTDLEWIGDDSQIVNARLSKIRSLTPGIQIRLTDALPDDFWIV